jgi:putative endopeptidase
MSDSTKKKAQQKLNTVMKKVGYPDKWRDYSSLSIDRSSYAENVMRGNKWYNDYQIAKLGKPVDRTEWEMTPQTWNAYYNPSNNEIVLPAAAFIVPGLADSCVDDAIMYGYAAGSTIGHEITHGFDDQGSGGLPMTGKNLPNAPVESFINSITTWFLIVFISMVMRNRGKISPTWVVCCLA